MIYFVYIVIIHCTLTCVLGFFSSYLNCSIYCNPQILLFFSDRCYSLYFHFPFLISFTTTFSMVFFLRISKYSRYATMCDQELSTNVFLPLFGLWVGGLFAMVDTKKLSQFESFQYLFKFHAPWWKFGK